MRFAVADTGSNTIRLGIYDYEHGHLNLILNTAVFANLAGFIQNGVLSPDGIRAAEEAVLLHKQTAAEYGCDLNVFATAAIRNAKNTEEICREIKTNTGAAVHVLSGEEEALFSFLGAVDDFPCTDGVMADVGGGSSEIILFSNKQAEAAQSVPWGSLKAYKAFVHEALPNQNEICAIRSVITDALNSNPTFRDVTKRNLCIVGGGVRASKKLAKAFFNETKLSVRVVNNMLSAITKNPAKAQTIIETNVPKRAQTIVPALAVYSAVGAYFGAEQIFVSDKGIKEGYILSVLAKSGQ